MGPDVEYYVACAAMVCVKACNAAETLRLGTGCWAKQVFSHLHPYRRVLVWGSNFEKHVAVVAFLHHNSIAACPGPVLVPSSSCQRGFLVI